MELAGALDVGIRSLVDGGGAGICVVAVGGYGRRDLAPGSDVDVVVLHDGAAEGAVRRVLYAMWDAGLKVGHAVATPLEAALMARDHLDRLCALLTSRVVAGDADLHRDLERRLVGVLRRERAGLRRLLAAEQREVWDREPFALQELDVKEGRGGLRTLQRVEWDRRHTELQGEVPAPVPGDVVEAGLTMRRVRTALHAVTGRAVDRYAVDLRVAVGRWLGREPLEVAAAVYDAARRIDAFAAEWWPVEAPEADLVRVAGRRLRAVWRRFRGRPAAPPPEPPATALVTLLGRGLEGWRELDRLAEAGWFRRHLPELDHVWGLPQAAPFHEHPVGDHLGRTVVEAARLADDPTWGTLWRGLDGHTELFLAAFLHDAGKGLPGDHAVVGARLAAGVLHRLGLARDAPRVVGAVRHHLLLPATALRRDLADPSVVAEVGGVVAERSMLDLLTLLSVADGRATGSWSSWKEALLVELHGRVAERLSGVVGLRQRQRVEEIAARLGPTVPPARLERHLAGMPADYLARFTPEIVACHVRLGVPPPGPEEVRVEVLRDGPLDTVVVVAADRTGLLALVSGVLALHRISVLDAQITTRDDGVAVDTFRVVPDHGERISHDRAERLVDDLRRAVAGAIDVEERLGSVRRPRAAEVDVRFREEVGGLVVEVRAVDRPRLLHDCARALADAGVGIRLARIDTRRDRALDVFVLDGDLPPERRVRLAEMLRAAAG